MVDIDHCNGRCFLLSLDIILDQETILFQIFSFTDFNFNITTNINSTDLICEKVIETFKNNKSNAIVALWLSLLIISTIKLFLMCYDYIVIFASIIQLPLIISEWSVTLSLMIKVKNIKNREKCDQTINDKINKALEQIIGLLVMTSINVLLQILFFLFLYLFSDKFKDILECIFEKCKSKIRTVNFVPSIPSIPSIPQLGEFIDKIIEKLPTLKEKIEEYLKTFIEEEKKVKEKMQKFLIERHSKIGTFLKDKDDPKSKETFGEEIENLKELEKLIKDLNKEENEIELDILMNTVNKMHYIFNLGVDIIKECKEIITNILKEKTASLPSTVANKIESQINKIKEYTPQKFLDSKLGKPLKEALEKYGLSEAFLNNFKKDLLKERKERREKERKEFSIENNEYKEEENNLELNLFKLVMEEYSDEEFQKVIKKEIEKQLNKIIIYN